MLVRFFPGFVRWLALIVGVQILIWAVSGVFFAWNNIEEVRGDQFRREHKTLDMRRFDLESPDKMLLKPLHPVNAMRLRFLGTIPVYEFELEIEPGKTRLELYDGRDGSLISPIGRLKARAVALHDFNQRTGVKSLKLIENNAPTEYRDGPLPAWRVDFDHSSGTTIYVDAITGRIAARRNNLWRRADFLRMLSTMDYAGRDNFNHLPIRIATVLSLAVVLTLLWMGFRGSKPASSPTA